MNKYELKDILIYSKEKEDISFQEFIDRIPKDYNGLVFYKTVKDTIGRGGSSSVWGNVYLYNNGIISEDSKVALYKEPDVDRESSSYAEKLWSILGKTMLDKCRVPDIDLVKEQQSFSNEPDALSYRLFDDKSEELMNLSSVVDKSFSKEEQENFHGYIYIEHLLQAVKNEIYDNENYKKVEQSMIETLLLDSISNNPDRHLENWGLVKDKKTGKYTLALFDNALSFSRIKSQNANTQNSWISSYIMTKPPEEWRNKFLIGDDGETIVNYISQKYPEYFKEFVQKLANRSNMFFQEIDKLDIKTDEWSSNEIKNFISGKIAKVKNILKQKEEDMDFER